MSRKRDMNNLPFLVEKVVPWATRNGSMICFSVLASLADFGHMQKWRNPTECGVAQVELVTTASKMFVARWSAVLVSDAMELIHISTAIIVLYTQELHLVSRRFC